MKRDNGTRGNRKVALKKFLGFLLTFAISLTFLATLAQSASADNAGSGQTYIGYKFSVTAYTPQCNSQGCFSYAVLGQTVVGCLFDGSCAGKIDSVTSYSRAQVCATGKDCGLTGIDWVSVGSGWESKRCPPSGTGCGSSGTTANFTFDCGMTSLYKPYLRTIAKSWVVDKSGFGKWGPTVSNVAGGYGAHVEGSQRIVSNCAGYSVPVNAKLGWMPHACFSYYARPPGEPVFEARGEDSD